MHYVEKPETFVSTLINGGAYLFTPEIFEALSNQFTCNYEELNKLVKPVYVFIHIVRALGHFD